MCPNLSSNSKINGGYILVVSNDYYHTSLILKAYLFPYQVHSVFYFWQSKSVRVLIVETFVMICVL